MLLTPDLTNGIAVSIKVTNAPGNALRILPIIGIKLLNKKLDVV